MVPRRSGVAVAMAVGVVMLTAMAYQRNVMCNALDAADGISGAEHAEAHPSQCVHEVPVVVAAETVGVGWSGEQIPLPLDLGLGRGIGSRRSRGG